MVTVYKEDDKGRLINTTTNRVHLDTTSEGGQQSVNVPYTPAQDKKHCEAMIRPHIVPVIFIPGIMGSNLKAKTAGQDTEFRKYLWQSGCIDKARAQAIIQAAAADKSEKVWQVSSLPSLAWGLMFTGAPGRQQILSPEITVVDYMPNLKKCEGIFDKDPQIDLAVALSRGWGSVSATDYWPVMKSIELALNRSPMDMLEAFELIKIELAQDELAMAQAESGKETEQAKGNEKKAKKDALAKKELWTTLKKANDAEAPFSPLNPVSLAKGLYGKETPTKLTAEELTKSAHYQFRVYGGGYNWLNSNWYSANGGMRIVEAGVSYATEPDCLTEVVDAILKSIQAEEDPDCKQVILITHSMGGLVARAYQKKNPDKVLGVIHGAMPAIGAAAMYKRMRSGFGGVETPSALTAPLDSAMSGAVAMVLGDTADKVSVVLAHSVGALELAPSDTYGDEDSNYKQWLKVYAEPSGRHSGTEELLALPTKSPYEDIYASDAWYGLIPYVEKENPSELQNNRVDPNGTFNYKDVETGKIKGDLAYFYDNVLQAKKYHTEYVTVSTYHPNTFVQCMAGTSFGERAYNRVVWQSNVNVTNLADTSWQLVDDNKTGWLRLKHLNTGAQVELLVQPKSETDFGDGTVPKVSGLAPAKYVRTLFEQNDGHTDHQASWKPEHARLFAMYAAIKIVQTDPRET
ncbi:hypothetical protein [Hydromonas duriensis]|uniref:PGAP1-like protein n=1 Tax=Hydromonas duriensis TaxID=1527608 RepID=A0A4R6Y4J8_9BURK|nr:hypothetical protein [Hydromonas duriensis]TDR28940.1 PGAP1-like protein [Hydromonas duriensis]